jgi:hypothetical protein
MRLTAATLILFALPAFGLQTEPASDLSVHSAKLPGIELRFVDWHWRPDLFAEMEKGGGKTPEAKRNWLLFRLVNDNRLTFEKTRLEASNYALALWPNLDGKGMMFELRRIDMRLVMEPNAFAPLPDGTTVWKGPAKFETVPDTAERLSISIAEDAGKVNVTIHYGNRKALVSFSR